MATSDEAIDLLCAAMLRDYGAGDDFQLALGDLVGRFRRKHERHILDMEAARLLPLGADVLMARLGGCRATQYNRAKRGRMLSKSREAS